MGARMIAQALQKEEHRRSFGSLYVPAMVHAAVRSEAKRKIKPNDIFDFRHAAAALPHCRAFFTDGPLKKLITSQGKMFSRKRSGLCATFQRASSDAVKRARFMGLLPYVGE